MEKTTLVLGASPNPDRYSFRAVKTLQKKNIPVIANVDFGHTDPKITLPIGGETRIKADSKNLQISIIKH